MAIKSRVVLPYLVPQLIAPPRVNTKALSILASVAGEALTKYLHKILPALLAALSVAQGTPHEAQVSHYLTVQFAISVMHLYSTSLCSFVYSVCLAAMVVLCDIH
jgi:hypothetical protein